MLQDIIELVTFVKNRKPSLSDVILTGLNGSTNLYQKLFQAIAQGEVTDDETASRYLYKSTQTDKKYLMLKNRLRERLVNSLLIINKKKISAETYSQAVHIGHKYYYAARVMSAAGAHQSAIMLAKTALTTAERFHLTELTLGCAALLRSIFAYAGAKREFSKYDKLCTEAYELLAAELKSVLLVEQLYVHLARTKSHDEQLARQAKRSMQKVKKLLTRHNSFAVQDAYFRIGTLYYQLIKDYPGLLDLLVLYEKYLLQHPHLFLHVQKGKFALLRIGAYLYLREFEKGKQEAERAMQLFRRGSNNWFTTLENYFLLCMQAGDFGRAEQLFDLATQHERFAVLSEVKKETWKVFEAYLLYALPDRRQQKTFRIQKFLNEVPIFQKDKAGLYPAILIAQVLFLFEFLDESRLEKTLESLRIYATRHLKQVSAPRTINFIKIMRLLFHYQYDLKKAEAKIQLPLARMQQALQAPREERDTLEIISYEYLCARLLERLKTFNKRT
ncbi:MAG: hypothetical protein NZL95_03010 [Chitinophagales bacterium]|nr:hypothetical protein [Chitinophagales bacterium]MDW8427500.1 hypothetical protein [Chitinophagales bacterium]